MPVGTRQASAFRRNALEDGQPLNSRTAEQLLKPFLPEAVNEGPRQRSHMAPSALSRPPQRSKRSKPMRTFVKTQIHFVIYTIIHFIFSLYIRFRKAYHAVVDRIFAVMYYHHRTPEYIQRDVKNLDRLPQHLSVILEYNDDEQSGAGLENLVHDVGEIAAWCASAGIPVLSVYEKTGILKSYIPHTHASITQSLTSYFGASSPNKPTLSLRAPHLPSFSPPTTPPTSTTDLTSPSSNTPPHLTILLLSSEDGRATLIDLTKTLASMSQTSKLSPSDISSDLIDAEITESVMGEPDLLICFAESLVLQGYPPWQVRLTEMSCAGEGFGGNVEYGVFLRGLWRWARCEMRFGR